ncbi:MAG: hypothetical protein VSS75_015250 [Candidatus Parabeggiatoa sp.]|nr:hypothetical protein [Candidatus Parabeggiatoa sp.]
MNRLKRFYNILARGSKERKINDFLHGLDNSTIKCATGIPKGSPFITIGREVIILGPDSVCNLWRLGLAPQEIIPKLLACFDSDDKDWAANVLLYALTRHDAMCVQVYAPDIEKWRIEHKNFDFSFWQKWWTKNQGNINLIWEDNHFKGHFIF